LALGTAGSLTGIAGAAAGRPPLQKLFFVGGPQTVRGIDAGSAVGDAFWVGRGELGWGTRMARPVVFGDLGWAGSRDDWQHPGKPLAGAGVGASFLDGLIRADVAKGIRPAGGVRVYLYVDARF
ncbi:MAG TPA: ShlB/FhaC/HecB family hemolysin secretion/activation protein, partial [Gemmatimonadaceae bacterium]|nr:ShlB/FhaC/HecB family hemolysin secretion/activation protein [Gemmatimonadaceae bacterium]